MKTTASNYLTTTEVASLTKLSIATLTTYRSRGRFPQPDRYMNNQPEWKGVTVATWMAFRRPRGRPPKNV